MTEDCSEQETFTFSYQSAVDALIYLMTGTRPDIAYSIGAASRIEPCTGPNICHHPHPLPLTCNPSPSVPVQAFLHPHPLPLTWHPSPTVTADIAFKTLDTLYQSRVCKQAKNIYNIIANRYEHKTQILIPV
jgi:hypothetical protein